MGAKGSNGKEGKIRVKQAEDTGLHRGEGGYARDRCDQSRKMSETGEKKKRIAGERKLREERKIKV